METEEQEELMDVVLEEIVEDVVEEELATSDFDVICRVCLETNNNIFSINDVHWGEMWLRDIVYSLFRPKERIEVHMPKNMCRDCIEEMYVVNQFIQKYHSSSRVLMDVLKKEESLESIIKAYELSESQLKYKRLPKTEKIELYRKTYGDSQKHEFESSSSSKQQHEDVKAEDPLDYNLSQGQCDDNQGYDDIIEGQNDIIEGHDDVVTNQQHYYNKNVNNYDENEGHHRENEEYYQKIEEEYEISHNKEQNENYGDQNPGYCNENQETFDKNEGDESQGEITEYTDENVSQSEENDGHYQTEETKIKPAFENAVNDRPEVPSSEEPNPSIIELEDANSIIELKDVWYMCSTCDEPFDCYSNLERHKREANHRDMQIYVCPFPKCETSFKYHSKFVEHFRTHLDERPYKCSRCDKYFRTKDQAKTHLKHIHLSRINHQCDICQKGFKRKVHLDLHVKIHKGHKEVCFYCGKAVSPYTLYMHEHRHKVALGLVEPKQKHPGPKLQFQCHICSMMLSSKYCLENHIKRHGPKTYKCTMCDASYATEEHYHMHVKQKHTDGDYPCPFCRENLKQKHLLDVHQKKEHPGQKLNLFTCQLCDKNFSNKISFTEHMKVHEGMTNHYCEQCNKYFPSESKLNRHLRTHTGEKPFSCLYCDKKFATKDYLKTHHILHESKLSKKDDQDELHSNPDDPQSIDKIEITDSYFCEYCQQQFDEEQALNEHLQQEHSEVTIVEMVE